MRMICPNCGAQYEVADDLIPAAGRDVQCSNCGHTWLEVPGASVAAEDADVAEIPVAKTVAAASATPTPPPPTAPTAPRAAAPTAPRTDTTQQKLSGSIADAFADIAPDEPPAELPDTVSDFESAEGEPMPTAAPVRHKVDASIAAILKEEAAREVAARKSDMGAALESQTDLGLGAPQNVRPARPAMTETPTPRPTPRADETRKLVEGLRDDVTHDEPADVARMRATQEAVVTTVASASSRRELLPDIEEINSSLRSSAERDAPVRSEPEEIERKRGFRFGFSTVLIVFAIFAAIYVFAPQISAAVPALAWILDSYVAAVDAARIWVDIQMQALLEVISPATDVEN